MEININVKIKTNTNKFIPMNITELPFDILVLIVNNLNYNDSIHFLSTSKSIHFIIRDIYRVLIRKIMKYFNIVLHSLNLYSDTNMKEIYHTCNNVYRYFKLHPETDLSNILTYLVELPNDNILFEVLSKNIYFNQNCTRGSKNTIGNIESTYILTHATPSYVNVFLKCLDVPMIVVINAIYSRVKLYIRTDLDTLMILCDHLLENREMYFKMKNENTNHLNEVVIDFIRFKSEKRYKLVEKILKVMNSFDYNIQYYKIVDECFLRNNNFIFSLMLNEMKLRGIKLIVSRQNIVVLISEGHIEFLDYIINKCLGMFIKLYSTSIKDGLVQRPNVKTEVYECLKKYLKADELRSIFQ